MKTSRRWHSSKTHPPRRGWYEVKQLSDGQIGWRAWGNGQWWVQLVDGWIGEPEWDGRYQWRGPRQSIDLDYKELKR